MTNKEMKKVKLRIQFFERVSEEARRNTRKAWSELSMPLVVDSDR